MILPGIQHIIAFASGKGGVGRSTVLANLAAAFVERGLDTGLLDADIEDPGLLHLMGVQGEPEWQGEKVLPFEEDGLKAISLAFLLKEEASDPFASLKAAPVEPLEASLVEEGLQRIEWGELDYLLIELPPGRGRLTRILASILPLTGTVLVMTPQASAIPSLTKAAELFRTLQVPILGVIENLSFILCPYCLKGIEVFGHGLGRMMSLRLKAPLLGEVPIDLALRRGGERGEIVTAEDPRSPIAEVFRRVAENLLEKLGEKKR